MPLKFFDENTSTFADSRVTAEQMICGKTRQVVAIILLAPDGKRLCLTMKEAAREDGRLNLSPPQGDIGETESIWNAASRELQDELGVDMCGPVVYLGNSQRQLPKGHPRSKQYRFYRYNWVTAYSAGYDLRPRVPLAKANWYHFDALEYLTGCMSEEKGRMFKEVMSALRKKAGNNYMIRKSILENDPDRLLGTDRIQAVA